MPHDVTYQCATSNGTNDTNGKWAHIRPSDLNTSSFALGRTVARVVEDTNGKMESDIILAKKPRKMPARKDWLLRWWRRINASLGHVECV